MDGCSDSVDDLKMQMQTYDQSTVRRVCGHAYLKLDNADSSFSFWAVAKACLDFASFNAALRASRALRRVSRSARPFRLTSSIFCSDCRIFSDRLACLL